MALFTFQMSLPPTPIVSQFGASVRKVTTEWISNISDKCIVDILLKSDSYQDCETYREQCHTIWNFLGFFIWSMNKCTRLLNVDHKAFEKQIKKPLEQRMPGRPKILNDDEIQIINK